MPENTDTAPTDTTVETTGAPEATPAQLPDDHPLVKTLAAQKDEIKALKEKAGRLDAIEEASRTEALTAAEQLAEAQAKLAAFETRDQLAAWKADVSKDTGVPAAALSGSTLEELQAHAEILKPLITTPEAKGAVGPYVPPEGGAGGGSLGSPAQDFADLLSRELGQR